MPQITLDYSANIENLDHKSLFNKIHQVIASIADIKTCKSRATKQRDFFIGEGDRNQAYIYLQVALLPHKDRTDEIKKALAKNIIHVLKEQVVPLERTQKLQVQISVEITDLSHHYYKE